MESDRMGHLLGAITQEKLDEQRGVVQNEKRQYENQPYGVTYELIVKGTYPAGHPYSWSVIGSMEDLNAAALEDVHEWFKTYYGAANAVIVVAGDIDAETAHAKVKKYFGDIPSGPPIAKHDVWIARMTGTHRQSVQDRVPQSRIYKVWNIPQWGTAELDYLDLVSDVLARGKTSRLHKRLVYDDQIATDVNSYIDSREISSQFHIEATANPGKDLVAVEKAIDEELARLLQEGPTQKELDRVKSQYRASFIRGIERIGGFGGKSDVLAMNTVYGGDPDVYKTSLKRVEEATASALMMAARKWLSDGQYILEVHPFPEYATADSDVDRGKLPETDTPPIAQFPKLQRATLANGLKIVLAERHAVPMVNFNLLVDAGYAADQFGIPGTAAFALDMLDEGTQQKDALQISEELALLGANLNAFSNLDMSFVTLSTLKSRLDNALALYAEVILQPSFPNSDFERIQKQQIARIQREKSHPIQMALRVFPKLLYGGEHAYSIPLTGSGFEEGVKSIQRKDLIEFHKSWFKPNNATLVVVGDITLKEIQPKIERLFKEWKTGDTPSKNIGSVELPSEPAVYIVDKPGAIQSIILAGHIAPPKANPDEIAIEAMNNIFGGTFTARINMNLREDKHWSYGSLSLLIDAKGQRPFLVYAPVQTDKTKESVTEVLNELTGYLGDKPATEDELHKIQLNQTLNLAGNWETIGAVGGSINEIVQYGLPDDHFETYPHKIKALGTGDVLSAAREVLHPRSLTWVIVGDREKIEAGIKELGLGKIRLIDPDGNPVEDYSKVN
jgi:zinc protease